jgi:YbbR domain-containing protein
MVFPADNFFDKKRQKMFFSRLFRKIFFEDWGMKLVALIITLALWFGVTGLRTTTKQRFQNIPLNIRVSNNIEITNSPVTEVDVVLSGDKRKIDQLNPRDLVISLDLTDVAAGDRTVQILPENVSLELPQGVKLEEIQPNKIAVKLETVEEREIAVRAETEGTVADGFEIYSTTIQPQKIRVRGPASFIRTLDFVSTEKINLANLKEDFTAKQIPLNIVNPKATLLDTTVDVAFRIGEKRTERLFLIPVQTENGQKKATVILYGARSLLEGLTSESLSVELVKTETGESTLKLNMPTEIEGSVEIKKLKINP